MQLSQDLAGCTASWAHVTASLHSSRQDLAAKQAYLQGLQEQLRQDSLNQVSMTGVSQLDTYGTRHIRTWLKQSACIAGTAAGADVQGCRA